MMIIIIIFHKYLRAYTTRMYNLIYNNLQINLWGIGNVKTDFYFYRNLNVIEHIALNHKLIKYKHIHIYINRDRST